MNSWPWPPQGQQAQVGYAPPTAPQSMRVRCVRGLTLRAGPGTSEAALGSVPYGQHVLVLSRTANGWSLVQLPAGQRGYVADTCAEVPGGPWLV